MASSTATAEVSVTTTTTSSSPEDNHPHDDLITTFNAVIWVLAGLSGFFFFLRVYCKITRQRGLWWDDYVMGASWVCSQYFQHARLFPFPSVAFDLQERTHS